MLLTLLLAAVNAEIHELEIRLRDNVGETVSKLKLSNIKSTRAEAMLEFDGAFNFPVTLMMPSSINWDQLRTESYISTTLYHPSKLQVLTDMYGNFLSISGVPSGGNGIDEDIEIVQVQPGSSPDTHGFIQKIEEQKRREAAQPQGSFLSRNWHYIAIAFVVMSMMGGQQ